MRLAPARAGPLTVRAGPAQRDLGAMVLDASRPALFGVRRKGPIDLAWTLPGGRTDKKRIVVLKATEFEIGGVEPLVKAAAPVE